MELLAIKAVATGGLSSCDSDKLPQPIVANVQSTQDNSIVTILDTDCEFDPNDLHANVQSTQHNSIATILDTDCEFNPNDLHASSPRELLHLDVEYLETETMGFESNETNLVDSAAIVTANVTSIGTPTPRLSKVQTGTTASRTINSTKQFFPTQQQQRRRNRSVAPTNPLSNEEQSSFLEVRRKFVEAEEIRTIEEHKLKMSLINKMADERIAMERIEHEDRRREIDSRIKLREMLCAKESEYWNIAIEKQRL